MCIRDRCVRCTGVLSQLPRLLFLLRRGPCLGQGQMNPDELDAHRCLLLRADLQLGTRIVFPQLYLVQPGPWTALPLEDLCLQPAWTLYLDQHTHVFIWGGALTKGEAHAPTRQHAHQVAQQQQAGRFPAPETLAFFEGDSLARYMTARLIPSHKDLPEEQRESLPQLRALGEEAQHALREKLWMDTDDLSFKEFLLTVGLGVCKPVTGHGGANSESEPANQPTTRAHPPPPPAGAEMARP
eukprot:TRINITY_DN11389_c0_g1_i1.p1 TRINITY_DN11389_c0_g1~~TRINITY_DN11389_c0_g1_i1.p1  ORF type:complete len:241 (-),score=67.72 TRINITY_DN11389_c0_g1_i1:221-943(-)